MSDFKDFFLSPLGIRKKRIETGPRYADMYARSLSVVIDMSLIFYGLYPVFTRITQTIYSKIDMAKVAAIDPKAGFTTVFQNLMEAHLIQQWLVNFFVQLAIIGVLYVGCQMAFRTTPGRWFLGLKIVRHGTENEVARWRYVLRFLAYIPSAAPLMIGVIWAVFNRERRTWHDFIAGTDVIHTRPKNWYWDQFKRGVKWGWRRLRGTSPTVEQAVAEPAPEQGHANSDNPVQ